MYRKSGEFIKTIIGFIIVGGIIILPILNSMNFFHDIARPDYLYQLLTQGMEESGKEIPTAKCKTFFSNMDTYLKDSKSISSIRRKQEDIDSQERYLQRLAGECINSLEPISSDVEGLHKVTHFKPKNSF